MSACQVRCSLAMPDAPSVPNETPRNRQARRLRPEKSVVPLRMLDAVDDGGEPEAQTGRTGGGQVEPGGAASEHRPEDKARLTRHGRDRRPQGQDGVR